MASIKLSKSGNQYQLAVNGWHKSPHSISLTVIATDEPTEAAREAFSGNEEIELRDASIRITAVGYLYVGSIERVEDYPAGGMDIHGDDILADVWVITLTDEEAPEESPVEESPAEEIPFEPDEPEAEAE